MGDAGFHAVADTCGRAVCDTIEMASRLFFRSQITVAPTAAAAAMCDADRVPYQGWRQVEPKTSNARRRTVARRRGQNVRQLQLPVPRDGRNVGQLVAPSRRRLRLAQAGPRMNAGNRLNRPLPSASRTPIVQLSYPRQVRQAPHVDLTVGAACSVLQNYLPGAQVRELEPQAGESVKLSITHPTPAGCRGWG